MGLRIRIANPNVNKEERTFLSADYSSGTSLTVENNDSFTANNFVIVGEPGQEQTELKQISSISGNTTIVVPAALKFSHSKPDPVYESRYDKVAVERTATGDSSFSAISGSPFDLEWDNFDEFGKVVTLIEDTSGSSSYDYRWRFYNSVTGTYSAYSSTLPGAGLGRSTAGFVIKKVRRNKLAQGISDDAFYEYINDLQDLVYEEMPKAWWFSKEGTSVATTADTYKYAISDNWSDFLSMQYLLYQYTSGSTDNVYSLSFLTQLEFWDLKTDQNQTSSDHLTGWTLLPPDSDSAKGYIGVHATPAADSTCYLKPIYFFELTDISSFADTLVIPKPKLYEDYILYRIADDIKNDKANADKYNIRVGAGIESLKRRTKRQQGQREWRRYRGPRGYSKLFGEYGRMSNDDRRTYYW